MNFLINGAISGKCVLINSKHLNNIKNLNLNDKVIVIKELTLDILPYLSNVNGIIVEEGTLLSHIFIFLREINIPVIKIKNATKIYNNEDYVSF